MKTVIKIKDLEFDVNVFKGDNIPASPFSDSLKVIVNASDLDLLQAKYPEAEVVINRENPWYSVFVIPAWKKQRESYSKVKMKTLEVFKTFD